MSNRLTFISILLAALGPLACGSGSDLDEPKVDGSVAEVDSSVTDVQWEKVGGYKRAEDGFYVFEDFKVIDRYLYLQFNQTLEILDISDMTAPEMIQSVDVTGGTLYTYDDHLFVVGNDAYMFDLADLEDPSQVGSMSVDFKMTTMKNDHLFAINNFRFETFDVQNPTTFKSLGRTNTFDRTFEKDMEVIGDYGYLFFLNAYDIVDNANKASPSFVKESVELGHGFETAVSVGSHIYMTGDQTLYVYDTADPLAPKQIYSEELEYITLGLRVFGNTLVGEGKNWRVYFWDISDPAKPNRLATFDRHEDLPIDGHPSYKEYGYSALVSGEYLIVYGDDGEGGHNLEILKPTPQFFK